MNRGFRLTAATGLHKGDRPYQQDQVLVIAHPRQPGCVLGVVADGMGGRSGGRKASDQVIMTAQQLFSRYTPGRDEPVGMLRQLLDDAHTVIKLTALSSEQEPHSTIAAFLMNPQGDCAWIHAGDSRIYHFHRGRLVRRTRDHSYVQVLVDRGELTEAEANVHPQGNILLGCLGMTATPPPVETHFIPQMQRGDALLACSDGLWHYFTPEEMGMVLAEKSPREATELLVAEARRRARGTGDNISLAVLKLERLPKPPMA
ncbi:PP2C family protein-serine/threonine phosphatase [Variovorax sp. PAMC 28711]|uniref:PP2C family protein-serine/threonine phosphatase n=1 Tax=Variovorax sp. PAMC 28711 TaxID=1795631 RepID=UPI00078B846F|nr:protein phosphatase 2C domain-containing protein [Variovorax sp. PAMC 28711]AMM23068.1 serine/threonine protein phosphatase [Variovorax sp. PAMC 28711]